MGATTVKLDAEILQAITSVKPRQQTLAAYVREALRRDVHRQQMRAAAEEYRCVLRNNTSERELLEEWEAAPLAKVPRRRRK